MALGTVNVPGVSSKDLKDVRDIANTAKSTADAAKAAAQNAQKAAEDALQAIAETAKAIGAVPLQSGTLTYTGSTLSPAWNSYDSEKLTLGGTTTGTNAGNYTATFTPKNGYHWSDGTTDIKSITWTIKRASVNVPAQSGTLTYTATSTPKANYQWPDSNTAAKSVSWSIGKAVGNLSLNKTSASLNVGGTTTIVVTRSGDGAVTASSSDTSVATVSVSGTTVTVVTAKKAGTATITVKVTAGTNYTAPANKTCAITVTSAVYGASWDGTSTTKWTRTDAAAGFTDPVPYVAGASSYGSPFDTIQPWAGMVRSERTGGTMVAIPKFWYKLTQSGSTIKIQIADKATSGFSVAPAHMDRGDGKGERDVVYIGRYHCGATAYKSATGQKPKASITRSAARTAIHNLGANIWQIDFAMWFTIWLLYIVEFADWNTQKTIGKGCGNNSATENMGYTDSMPYHTGTTQSSRDTFGLGTQYRNIEGLWNNVYDWCDGCYNKSSGFNIILNPSNFSDSSGGTSAGTPSSGYSSAFAVSATGGFTMFIPTAASGNVLTHSCGYWGFGASNPCVLVGDGYSQAGQHDGLFYVSCAPASRANDLIGSRLQELP